VNIPRGIIILAFAAIVLELFVSIMNIFFCVIVGNYQLMVPPALATLPVALFLWLGFLL
jgi:hypothetical protein